MDRFLARKSASSVGSGSAAQPPLPANASSISSPQPAVAPSSTSAAQPALTPSSTSAEQPVVQFACLKDVRLWLATPEVLNGSLDVSALKEAVTVLSRVPKPRKEEVQPLLSKWGVAQKDKGKPRPLADVIRELEQKVVNAAHQLANSVPASAAQPATSSSEQLYKKIKREHATAGSSAAQPVSRKRAGDKREDAEVSQRVPSTTDNSQRPSKQTRMSSFLVPITPGAHPSSSSTQPLDNAAVLQSVQTTQQGWSRITAGVRALAGELRLLVRRDALREDLREMLLSNLSVLNSLRQLPCTRTVIRKAELKKLYQPYAVTSGLRQGDVRTRQDAVTR